MTDKNKDNLSVWNSLKTPPDWALKPIKGGRLAGKSDINPQWRYQAMTETLGMCGIGWKYVVINKHITEGSDGQKAAFVDIELYIKVNDEWSAPIPANGGSMFVENERSGPHTSDEAFKMATTDALGTAMKMIGMAADVYQNRLETKYEASERRASAQPAQTTSQRANYNSGGTSGSPTTISAAQSGRLYAIARGNGYSKEDIAEILGTHGYSHTKEITKSAYEAIVANFMIPKEGQNA